jgi:hypothetical protein
MKSIGWVLLAMMGILVGCSLIDPYTDAVSEFGRSLIEQPRIAVAEEKGVSRCTYIDTISENTDMGAFQIHPKFSSDVHDKVLQKAERLGATHIVWLADYAIGASAMVYYCGN